MLLQKEIGTVVNQMRLELGLSEEELANRSMLTKVDINEIEQGIKGYYFHNLVNIANALDVYTSVIVAVAEELLEQGQGH